MSYANLDNSGSCGGAFKEVGRAMTAACQRFVMIVRVESYREGQLALETDLL